MHLPLLAAFLHGAGVGWKSTSQAEWHQNMWGEVGAKEQSLLFLPYSKAKCHQLGAKCHQCNLAPGWLCWRAWTPITRGTSRGRRGARCHPGCFCVAGVALAALGWLLVTSAMFFLWQAWHLVTSTCFCVAGVALCLLGDIHLAFSLPRTW